MNKKNLNTFARGIIPVEEIRCFDISNISQIGYTGGFQPITDSTIALGDCFEFSIDMAIDSSAYGTHFIGKDGLEYPLISGDGTSILIKSYPDKYISPVKYDKDDGHNERDRSIGTGRVDYNFYFQKDGKIKDNDPKFDPKYYPRLSFFYRLELPRSYAQNIYNIIKDNPKEFGVDLGIVELISDGSSTRIEWLNEDGINHDNIPVYVKSFNLSRHTGAKLANLS
jgi:hypothetical protein